MGGGGPDRAGNALGIQGRGTGLRVVTIVALKALESLDEQGELGFGPRDIRPLFRAADDPETDRREQGHDRHHREQLEERKRR